MNGTCTCTATHSICIMASQPASAHGPHVCTCMHIHVIIFLRYILNLKRNFAWRPPDPQAWSRGCMHMHAPRARARKIKKVYVRVHVDISGLVRRSRHRRTYDPHMLQRTFSISIYRTNYIRAHTPGGAGRPAIMHDQFEAGSGQPEPEPLDSESATQRQGATGRPSRSGKLRHSYKTGDSGVCLAPGRG